MGYLDLRFDKDSTFLVTGAAGFIGSNLCEALTDMGYQVRSLDDLSTGKEENIQIGKQQHLERYGRKLKISGKKHRICSMYFKI